VVPKSDDGTTRDTIFEEWGNTSLQAGDAFGKTLRVVDMSAQYMKDAGLEDVTEQRFKCPLGGWAKEPHLKELGRYNRLQWEEGLEGWTMFLLTTVLCVRVPKIHLLGLLTLIFGFVIVEAGRSGDLSGSNEGGLKGP